MNECIEGQGFGLNYNPSYKADGLIGHTGQDWGCGFGTPIHSLYDGIVTLVWTPDKPASDGYTAVRILVDDGNECFEWEVGHCNPSVVPGQTISKGDVIATEANHGVVYSGNILITLAMQKAGDQRGHHRHYQKRPVMPMTTTDMLHQYLLGSITTPYRDQAGYYYQIFDYNNGFDGCVDPTAPVFLRDLTIGSSGYDVFVLQRILKRHGFFNTEPTGYFGLITAAAVARYQSVVMGITPTSYFGPKTRVYALRELSPLPVLSGE